MTSTAAGPGSAQARNSAHRVAHDRRARALARVGLAGHGAVYILIGILALALAFGQRSGSTDQSGAVQTLAQNAAGLVLLVVIAVGLTVYALWQFFQAASGHLTGGKDDAKDRALCAIRGVINGSMAVLAFSTITDRQASNQSKKQQNWTASIMNETGGRWLIAVVGLVVIGVGVVQIVVGLRRKFVEEFERERMSDPAWKLTLGLGVGGKCARGVVVALVGVLLLTAAIQYDPKEARGVDGALRTLRETPAGPWLLVLVAAGLVAFGLYGFCEARWRKL